MNIQSSITPKRLRDARKRFALMLKRKTKESDWQLFFTECPFVLSESLPLRLDPNDITPLGRIGKSEADFIFYPKADKQPSFYGVIELKRPDTRILTIPRKNVLKLSSDSQTALAQAQLYAKELNRKLIKPDFKTIAIGNDVHIFMIIGLSNEIADKIVGEVLMEQYHNLLPQGFRIIPYDTLYEIYTSKIPPVIHILVPQLPIELDCLPVVDYTLNGTITGIPLNESSLFLGVAPILEKNTHRFFVKNPGFCIYCGQKEGYESKAQTRRTLLGEFQYFISDEYKGKASRLLTCSRMTSPSGGELYFRELYDENTLKIWYEQLRKGKCLRCSKSDVKFTEWDNRPVEWKWRYECNSCGFYEEYHGWGPSSAGA